MKIESLTRSFGVLLATGLLFVPGLWAADAPLVGDTYISSASAGSNFGAATSLVVAPGNAGLVQFDLTAIPAGATIATAYLRVYINKISANGTLSIAPVTASWTELGVTFASAPSVRSAFATAPASVANSFVLVDVTALAQGWLSAPASNFGIEITGVGSTSVQLDTKENTATSHPATLELTIVGPAGPTGSTGIAGLPGNAGPIGAAGATGPSGPAGAAGTQGAQGLSGAQGSGGPTGPSGPAGAQGATGAQGLSGPRGATGAQGNTGPSGSQGASGAVGPTGPAGASGANGPTGNKFALDTALHASGYIIPDTDTFLYYLTNNPQGTPSACGAVPNIVLPHSTTVGSGRVVIVSPGNVPNSTGVQCPGVSVTAQAGDTVIPTGVNASAHPLNLVSDGAGHWIIMNSGGR
jgi:hypothetical protein